MLYSEKQVKSLVVVLKKVLAVVVESGEWGYWLADTDGKDKSFSPAKWLPGLYPSNLTSKTGDKKVSTSVLMVIRQCGLPCPNLETLKGVLDIVGKDTLVHCTWSPEESGKVQKYINWLWESGFKTGGYGKKVPCPKGTDIGIWNKQPKAASRLLAMPDGVGDLIGDLFGPDIDDSNPVKSIITADSGKGRHK